MLLDVDIRRKDDGLSTSPVATEAKVDITEVNPVKTSEAEPAKANENGVEVNGNSQEHVDSGKHVNGDSQSSKTSKTSNGNHVDGAARSLLNGALNSLHSHKSLHGKAQTLMPKPHMRTKKRIIVCCDGTWQDGVEQKKYFGHSDLIRFAKCRSDGSIRTF